MGAGKSTLGRILAALLEREFVDSDRVIEERAGANIPWIFDLEGEVGFRDRETQVIDELTQQADLVLATGGGAVMRSDNRRFLASRGVVVYLRTRVESQLARTEKDRNRPLLQQQDPHA
ncbi:MAG: shikimate kinase, partial [Natronospirillum sp.]